MSDRNLYFQMLNNNRQQRKLQRPLLRGNYLPERKPGDPFYGNAIYQENQLQFGGADKNLFFQMQEKGKVRLVPFMLKRQFKDLEPSSRIIGSLDTTKEERQASSLVKGIQNISSLLDAFISEPETDASGNPIFDDSGNIKTKKKNLSDILTVARDSVKEMLTQAQVPANDTFEKLIDSMDVKESKQTLEDAEEVIGSSYWDEASQERKSELLRSTILNVVEDAYTSSEDIDIKEGDEPLRELSESELSDEGDVISGERDDLQLLERAILENKGAITGDYKKDGVPRYWDKEDWDELSDDDKREIANYIVIRRNLIGEHFRNHRGHEVTFKNIRRVLGQGFSNDHILDLELFRMKKMF